MLRSIKVLLLGLSISFVSGCGGIYVSTSPYSYSCYYEYVPNSWGGYEQQYCYDNYYGGYVPYINNGYYVIRYPYSYRGPQVRVAPSGSRRVVVRQPTVQPRSGRTVVRTRGSRGGTTVVTPGVDRSYRRGSSGRTPVVTPRGPTRSPRGPSHSPAPSRGSRGGRVHPRKAVIELPASQLHAIELRGASFEGSTIARYIDPSVDSGKVIVEAVIYGESDRAIDRYIRALRKLRSVDLNLDQGTAVVGLERDLCNMSATANSGTEVSGVCIDDITILTSREIDAPIVVNESFL